MQRIAVRELHSVEWALDIMLVPFKWAIQCFRFEALQRTHRWNNHHLSPRDVEYLDPHLMVSQTASHQSEAQRWVWGFIPLFHLACFGGWKHYVVLSPDQHLAEEWHVG